MVHSDANLGDLGLVPAETTGRRVFPDKSGAVLAVMRRACSEEFDPELPSQESVAVSVELGSS